MAKPKQEELKDGREQTSGSPSGSDGTKGTTDSGTSGTEVRESGNASGTNPTSTKGNTTKPKRDRNKNKQSIIEQLRNEANKGDSEPSDGEHRRTKTEILIADRDNKRSDIDNAGHNRVEQGTTANDVGGNRQVDGTDGSSDNLHSDSETNRIKGIKIDVPVIKPTGKQKPVKFSMEQVLNKTEAKDMKPRIVEALMFAFTMTDKGLGMASKNPATKEVFIWQTITKEEADIIATAIIETAMKVPTVAVITRRVARDYTKMTMGIILVPRFLMSVQHLWQNTFNFKG